MIQNKREMTDLQEAEILDNLLDIVAKDPEPNRPTFPRYMHDLEKELGIDRETMTFILEKHVELFHVKGKTYMRGEYSGEVSATPKAKVLYRSGYKFVAHLEIEEKKEELLAERSRIEREIEQEVRRLDLEHKNKMIEQKERELRIAQQRLDDARADKKKNLIWKIATGISTFLMLCFAAWAAWGSDNSKVHDQKEQDWVVEKRTMQSQIDATNSKVDILTRKLDSIPNSIRSKYIK